MRSGSTTLGRACVCDRTKIQVADDIWERWERKPYHIFEYIYEWCVRVIVTDGNIQNVRSSTSGTGDRESTL